MRSALVLFVALFAAAASAQPDRVVAIRAGRLVDVDRGQVLTGRTVVVRGSRIEAILDAATPLPAGAEVIDLSAHTVLPGLIDCHTHLNDDADGEGGSAIRRSEARMVLDGVRNAQRTLQAGFTTVRDVGTWRAFADVALRDAIDAGVVPGPRMAVSGAYVTVNTGGGDVTGLAADIELPRTLRFGVANSADEVRDRVRALLHGGANFIKIIATGAVLTRGTVPGAPEYSEAELRAAAEEAAYYGARVTAHAHGADGIKRAVRAGIQSIEHGSFLDDEGIALMKAKGAFLVADIYNADYIDTEGRRQGWPQEYLRKNLETADAQRQGFRKAVQAGVRIAYGTDAGVYPHGDNAKQLPYMVTWGMSPMQAVQSATIRAAENIGWEDRVGSIAPGKFADIIAVEGDALSDLDRFMSVSLVMKDGRVHRR